MNGELIMLAGGVSGGGVHLMCIRHRHAGKNER